MRVRAFRFHIALTASIITACHMQSLSIAIFAFNSIRSSNFNENRKCYDDKIETVYSRNDDTTAETILYN